MFQIDYNEIYGLEIFNHFEDTSNEEKRNFIIETGFNLYFIYLLYQKLKTQTVTAVKTEEIEEEDVT